MPKTYTKKEQRQIDLNRAKKKQLTERLSILATLMAATLSIAFYLLNIYVLGFICLGFTAAFFICNRLAGGGYFEASRFLLIILANAFVTLLCMSGGRISGFRLLFFPLASSILIIYSFREFSKMAILLALTILCIFFLEFTDYQVTFIRIELNEQLIRIFSSGSMFLAFLVTLYCIYYLLLTNNLAEDNLLKEKANIESLIEHPNDYIALTDRKFNLITFNESFVQMSLKKYGFEPVTGNNFIEEITSVYDRDYKWHPYMERALAGEFFSVEHIYYFDGDPSYEEISFNPVDDNGSISGVVIFGRNITNRKIAEQQQMRLAQEEKRRNRRTANLAELGDILRKYQDEPNELYDSVLSFFGTKLQALQGAFYVPAVNNPDQMRLEGVFALDRKRIAGKNLVKGEGFTGQAWLDKKQIFIHDLPEDYFKLGSALGEMVPDSIGVIPLVFNEEVRGIIELAFNRELSAEDKGLLQQSADIIAATVELMSRKLKTEALLQKSQELNERLKTQEEELRVSNEELLEKSKLLQASEEELRVQQEELMQTNENLELKARQLEEQNDELEITRQAINLKAQELERTSRYKSEFLANMSHELRTPLNSILILTNVLKENKEGRLKAKELELVRVINKSGEDLLGLINDVLDLSKLEARKVELELETVNLTELSRDIESMFVNQAEEKDIKFKVINKIGEEGSLVSDRMRIDQILKNLLSNAFKFTPKGGEVSLEIFPAPADRTYNNPALAHSPIKISFAVKDSGIGIPSDKQALIFEAFKQADGSTNRKYGGTGLGLSISRELANLLGGDLILESVEGKGSTFTLVLPQALVQEIPSAEAVKAPELKKEKPKVKTEVKKTERPQKLIAIIEDDVTFAEIIAEQCRAQGFETVVSHRGDEGLRLIREKVPDAIILDIGLPVMDGWKIMKKLKEDDDLQAIPVHILSGGDNEKKGMELGAVDFFAKPVSQTRLSDLVQKIRKELQVELKKVLIVEDNEEQNIALRKLLSRTGAECSSAYKSEEALALLKTNHYDLVILDLVMPDMPGIELLRQIRSTSDLEDLPVIVYTGKDLSAEENQQLSRYTSAIVIKTGKSFDRLLDETTLFLNKLKKGKLHGGISANGTLRSADASLTGKKILLVDDDMRNIFALNQVFEQYNMNVLVANDGKEAMDVLAKNDDVDLVLMDIMMPGMDGYEATREIRKNKKWKNLPVIAVTAKAMKGDKEKILEAGASDYISKPVDVPRLLSLMKVWMSK